VARLLFRVLYGALLAAVFAGAVWFGFRRAIVGRSVTVPDLAGKTPEEAIGVVRRVGLQFEEQSSRARYDDRIAAGRVLLQQPEAGSLAKAAQIERHADAAIESFHHGDWPFDAEWRDWRPDPSWTPPELSGLSDLRTG